MLSLIFGQMLQTDQSCDGNKFKTSRSTVLENLQTDVYQNLCCHKKHLRLESLKTLILADNALTKIQLSTDDITTFSETEETEWTNIGVTKLRLLYPNLSMLDISNNCLKVRIAKFLNWKSEYSMTDFRVFVTYYFRKCPNFYISSVTYQF